MKRLFTSANQFLSNSDWKDIAVLKFCLLALGMLAGMQIPKNRKKNASIAASIVFILTYIPLMSKFLDILVEKQEEV